VSFLPGVPSREKALGFRKVLTRNLPVTGGVGPMKVIRLVPRRKVLGVVSRVVLCQYEYLNGQSANRAICATAQAGFVRITLTDR
jgi:hypothetical protein